MATLVARGARGARIGVALGSGELSAAIRRPGSSRVEAWRTPLSPLNGDGSSWPGLTDALRLLARDTGIVGGRLTIALLPPLAEARGVSLPPVADDEAQLLLTRSAAKFFVAGRGSNVVGATPGAAKSGGPMVAAAANARLVNAIEVSVRAAGWTLEAVVPAEAAWAAAATQWSARRGGVAQLLVAHPDRTDLVTVEGGTLRALRRFRAGDADASLIADAFASDAARLTIVGDDAARHALSRGLSARGIAVEAPPTTSAEVSGHPELLAAAFASPQATPALLTDSMRAQQRATAKRVATILGAVAAVLFVGSVVVEWWGLRREAEFVRSQRAALAPQISTTLVGRTTVEAAFRQLAVLNSEERAAAHWSTVLAALSERLPPEAFLTGFRGRGDSVSINGLATRAARVFDAVERVQGLVQVRSAGPVRIETQTEGPPLERFSIAAQLAPRVPPRPVAPPPAPAPAVSGASAPGGAR